mgnify:CR=1 FL=1
MKLLVERDDVEADSKNKYGRTPLSYAAGSLSFAAEYGLEALVKLLVERDDVEVDSMDNNDRTPLLWAARYGREAMVELLNSLS